MSRYGGGGGRERERDRYDDRRRSVDVTYEERDRVREDVSRDREFRFDESFETYRDSRTSGALVPIHQERIIERDIVAAPAPQERFMEIERIERIDPVIEVEVEKKITEHEHEHHHHHIVIDHGTTYINAAPPPPPPPVVKQARAEVRERETTRVTLEGVRERRYGTNYRSSGEIDFVETRERARSRPREIERERDVKIEYKRYNDYSYDSPRRSAGILPATSPRSSVGGLGQFEDWNVTDVKRKYDVEIDGRITSGIRRQGPGPGAGKTERKELWTEVTKDLVARDALEEFGFYYEETNDFYYIFEYLSRDQITDLIELTKDIRREKVRAIERDEKRDRERGRSVPAWEHDRVKETREFTPYGERDRFAERRDVYYT